MNRKLMREKLSSVVDKVPKSTADMTMLFIKTFGQEAMIEMCDNQTATEVTADAAVETVAYVGYGDEPPHMIDFLGVQRMVRGQKYPISEINPSALEKMQGHRCFVFGDFDSDDMFDRAQVARDEATKQQGIDEELPSLATIKNSK